MTTNLVYFCFGMCAEFDKSFSIFLIEYRAYVVSFWYQLWRHSIGNWYQIRTFSLSKRKRGGESYVIFYLFVELTTFMLARIRLKNFHHLYQALRIQIAKESQSFLRSHIFSHYLRRCSLERAFFHVILENTVTSLIRSRIIYKHYLISTFVPRLNLVHC